MTAVRSNGAPGTGAGASSPVSVRQAECLECGGLYAPQTLTSEFCRPACRQAFHHRIQARGAILYSLYMAIRYERSLAKILNLWSALGTCAASFHREDKEKRAGRRSWRKPTEVLEQHAFRFVKIFRVR